MVRTFLGSSLMVLAVACGGEVVSSPGQSGDQAAGSGAASNTTSGAGAAGGNTGAGGSSTSSASMSGGGGLSTACAGFVEVLDELENTKLTSICANSWGATWSSAPVGYFVNGGPAPGIHNLVIEGCSNAFPGSEAVRLSAEKADVPGGYAASISFTDGQGAPWDEFPPGSAKLTLTALGPEGGAIDGMYFATVAKEEITLTMQGSFSVCRVEDENVP